MTLEEVLEHCRDRDEYPKVFNDNVGSDIKLDGYNTVIRKGADNKRVCKLIITSYLGMCIDAIHYYGRLEIEGITFTDPDSRWMTSDENTRAMEKKNPLAGSRYHIDLVRPLLQEEIDNDPVRWEGYPPGVYVNNFDSIEAIIELAQEVFEQRFSGDWEFEIEDLT
jgi:hypothetical protein